MQTVYWLIALFMALLAGSGFGYQLRKMWAVKKKDLVETKVETLINDAKAKQKQLLLEANDKALKIIEDAKVEEKERQQEMIRAQKRLEKREGLFDQKLLELESKKQELLDKAQKIESVKEEIGKIKEEQLVKLEKVASLTKEEARQVLLDNTERQMKDDLLVRIKKLQEQSSIEVERKARDIIALAIQRCAVSHSAEGTTSTIDLPSDELKGRIIGREGRNIRTIERLTGVEIIVDDTPQAITVSGFSPIRRHVAKKALENLIADGRIHPARIEEAIAQAKQEIALEIQQAGENAVYELGVTGLDPKLVQIIGRLKYRTSYGQNILQHSIEIAHLSALLAEMLGADVTIAKKGGLLHDIGKAVDHEVQGTHPEIGYDILKKFGVAEEIAYIAKAHHDDNPQTLECVIVKVADAISGARPGARKDTYEQYLQRLEELEKVANAFDGVEKSYAVQAGREIRVFVVPEAIDDLAAHKLAGEIARKIESELKYPGEIKVTVIRETRVIEYAR
ncbi:MAG: ribonuclease Y [Patescibacteria group bacterium]|jgi:ribonuclease Y|nr:ribonuclease Y [Patescibacteria group bacterium]